MQFIVYFYRINFNSRTYSVVFFKKYVQLFDDANLKPKTHFVFYYSHMIEQFGTLVKTVRFKTNSISVKGLYSSNKKRKNIHPNALYR